MITHRRLLGAFLFLLPWSAYALPTVCYKFSGGAGCDAMTSGCATGADYCVQEDGQSGPGNYNWKVSWERSTGPEIPGKAGPTGPTPSTSNGDPVLPSGGFFYQETDLSLPGATSELPFTFTRTYRSDLWV